MKKIFLLLSIFFSLWGYKAFPATYSDDNFGEMLEVDFSMVNGFLNSWSTLVADLKMDIPESSTSFNVKYYGVTSRLDNDAAILQTKMNAALQSAGAWLSVSSVNTGTKTITFNVTTPNNGQPLCFKTSVNGRVLKLGRVPASLEIVGVDPDRIESTEPDDVAIYMSEDLYEGRKYIIRRHQDNGDYEDYEYIFSSLYAEYGPNAFLVYSTGDERFQIILKTHMTGEPEIASNMSERVASNWPYYSLVEVDPGDKYMSNDGTQTVTRRYKLPYGGDFSEVQLQRVYDVIDDMNYYQPGMGSYSEYIQIYPSYDPVAKELVLEFKATGPNPYQDISYPVDFDQNGTSYTILEGGFHVEIQPLQIEGMLLTEPYTRHAIKINGAQKAVRYKLYRDGVICREYNYADDNGLVLIDNIYDQGTYTVKGAFVGYQDVDMIGNYYVATTAIQPFDIVGSLETYPNERYQIKVLGHQNGVTYKLYLDGRYVTEKTASQTNTQIWFDNLLDPGVYTIKGFYGDLEEPMRGSYTIEYDIQLFTVTGEKLMTPYIRDVVRLSGAEVGIMYKLYRNGQYVTEKTATSDQIFFDDLTIPGIYTVKALYSPLNVEINMTGSYTLQFELLVFDIEGGELSNGSHVVKISGPQRDVTYTLYRDGQYVRKITAASSPEVTFENLTTAGIYTVKANRSGYMDIYMMGSYAINKGLNISRDKNYIMVHTYTSTDSKLSTITYMDDLGRKTQSINIQALSEDRDMVNFTVYDAMGRADSISYLPFTGVNGGGFYNDPVSAQESYYKFEHSSDPDAAYAYALTDYSTSPVGQVTKTTSPGENGALYPMEHTYELNKLEDGIIQFKLDEETKGVELIGPYAEGELTVIRSQQQAPSSNEHMHPITSEYKDVEGNMVAKSVRYNDDDIRTTYYVYDDLGRQRYIIPAIQVDLMSSLRVDDYHSLCQKYCYYTEYDKFGNVVKQYMPGMTYSHLVYDNRGRVVLSQSGNLHGDASVDGQKWAFTKYDELDRPIMTGILTGGTYEEHLQGVQAQTLFGESRNGPIHGYTNNCYPVDISENDVLTVTYYDDYDWIADPEYQFSSEDALGQQQSDYIISLTTGSKTKVLGVDENIWLTSAVYYDDKYNTIQTIGDLYPAGKEVVTNKHDWSGNINQTKVKQISNAGTYEYNKWFDYDERGKLSNVRQKITDDPNGEIVLASYEYNDMGKVISKSVHDGIDTTHYKHTLGGVQIEATSDYFSYRLELNNTIVEGQAVPYTGNVAQVSWTNAGGEEKAYKFEYDRAGQMLAANLFEKNNGSWVATNKFSETGISYDKNGNILSLKRTDHTGRIMQDLEYEYYGGNQLVELTANGKLTGGYYYDANGNMIEDGHTGVKIEYNILDLPEKIFDKYSQIRYIYSATGEKLASEADGSLTYYRNVMVYSKNGGAPEHLSHMLQPEGIVQYNNNSTGSKYTYKYFKTDHLGSTRAVVAAIWNNGTYTMNLEQSTDYYPFGLVHEYGDLAINKYLFSGKELQDVEMGPLGLLGLYDFGSRYYNPFLGRWFNMDPAHEFTNPYIYCGNSPMMFVDPNGESLIAAILIGAAIGATMYTVSVAVSPGGFDNFTWGGFFKSAAFGALSGAASFGIGQVFDGLAKATFASEFLRGVTHGYVGGMMSGMQGGDFLSGFASGALSSFMSSGYGAATKNALSAGTLGQADYTAGMLAVGALSGGVGAELAGGKFWHGAGQGFIVAALNHLAEGAKNWKDLKTVREKIQTIMSELYETKQQGVDIVDLFAEIPGMGTGIGTGYGYGHSYYDSKGRYFNIEIGGENLKVYMLDIGGYKSKSLNIETSYREMKRVTTLGTDKTNFNFWNNNRVYQSGGSHAMMIQVHRSSEAAFMRLYR